MTSFTSDIIHKTEHLPIRHKEQKREALIGQVNPGTLGKYSQSLGIA